MSDFNPDEIDEILTEKETPLTGYSEPRYVVSFINGQPGLVVRGNSASEIESSMTAILPYFRKFREAVEKSRSTVKQAGNEDLGDNKVYCKTCKSEMTLREGMGKRGPWKGYFCPNGGRDIEGHQPLFI